MKKKRLTPIQTATLCVVLLALLFSMQACTLKQQRRMLIDPIKINNFYTTSYSGVVKQEYEWLIKRAKSEKYFPGSVGLRNAPPRIDRFRWGERVCVAVHSDMGKVYEYFSLGDPELTPTRKTSHPWLYEVFAFGESEVVGTEFKFDRLLIGGTNTKRWEVACIKKRDSGDNGDRYKPDKWVWLDNLAPGRYIVKFKAKDRDTDRSYKLETAFTVE